MHACGARVGSNGGRAARATVPPLEASGGVSRSRRVYPPPPSRDRAQFAGISALNADCTDTTGIVSQGPDMEGQALMREAATGRLFAMGSHLTGWAPNAMIFVATASKTLPGATWVNETNPTHDSTSFGTQSTFM